MATRRRWTRRPRCIARRSSATRTWSRRSSTSRTSTTADDELVEAQALYERAIGLESDFFEAHFNLGNIYHDLGEFDEAQALLPGSAALNPYYADTHFYLAVTLEKMGLSQEARPHWRSYQQLAPQGEWVELAREFSE